MKRALMVFLTVLLTVITVNSNSGNLYAYAAADDNDVNFGEDFDYEYEEGSNFLYNVLDDGTITINGYTGSNSEVYVPPQINGYTVTRITPSVLKGPFNFTNSITKVVLPDTVTTLDDGAFECCYNLEYLYIPKSVKSIGGNLLRKTKNLTGIDFDNNNDNYTYINGVIYDKALTTAIAAVGGLETVTLPSTVTKIGRGAFYGCAKLSKINGAENITEIYERGFSECEALKNIDDFTSLTTIKSYAFSLCYGFEKLTIPDSVINLASYAFEQCYMNELHIKSNISSIPSYAFENCLRLKKLTIDEGVTSIGKRAFNNCWRLTNISFPSTLKTISDEAFYGMDGNSAFIGDAEASVFIPEGVKTIGKNNFGYRLNSQLVESKNTGFIIYGYKSSTAEKYANDNGLVFIDVENLYNIKSLGGSLRLSGTNGLRLGFRLTDVSQRIDKAKSVEFGFVYSYSSNTDNLTLENVGTNGVKRKTAENYTTDDNTRTYNLVFINIPSSAFKTDISARAYAIINGVTYYSQPLTRNTFYVAENAIKDPSLSDTTKEKIRTIYGL